MTIFIFQLVLYLFLGFSFVFLKKYKWGLFIMVIGALLPYSPIFSAYFYYSGSTVFDFYIIGLGLGSVCLSICSKSRVTFTSKYIFILGIIVLYVFLSYCISLFNSTFVLISALKDLKPMLLIALLFYTYRVVTLTSNAHNITNVEFISNRFYSVFLPILLCVKAFVFLYLNSSGHLSSGSNDDFYVTDSEMLTRYADFSIVFIFIMVLFSLGKRQIYSVSALYYSFLGIVLSGVAGNRTFLVIFLFLAFYCLYKSRRILFYFILFFSSFIVSLLFINFDIDTSGRFFSILSFDNVIKLLSVRYSPLLALYDGRESYFDYLFGLGLGTSFYIPWFAYRDGVDPFSPFIDNFYLTIFTKFGLLGVFLVIFSLFKIAFVVLKGVGLNFVFFILFALYATTMSFWYQSSFSYLAICWFTLFLTSFNAKKLASNGY